jgi:RimJ/RimL family protein N-acetyltransferase
VTSVPGIDVPTIETARLRLRGWQPDDVAPYTAMRADPEVARYLGNGQPQTAAEVRAGLEWGLGEWARLGLGRWAVEERSNGTFVGYCGLLLWREGTSEEVGELGYGYAREAWGKGYATEAAAAAMHWGFEVGGHDSLVALTWPENRASQHVLAKLGFTPEGEADGQYVRLSFFRVTRAVFEASPPFRAARAASD